ncbi:MAG: Asp23/Gls24 family envelope stress response protein [Anaerolineales bacterium]|nr:Asp23/Gls24 family envelope stress response protein [Anaerolineales bacterium]
MNENDTTTGMTTIAPDVIMTIARLTALKVDGVLYMSQAPVDVARLIKRGAYNEGVFVQVEGNTVNLDLYVVLGNGISLLDVGRKIQKEVERSIIEMVGMDVGKINVHIEDIDFSNED